MSSTEINVYLVHKSTNVEDPLHKWHIIKKLATCPDGPTAELIGQKMSEHLAHANDEDVLFNLCPPTKVRNGYKVQGSLLGIDSWQDLKIVMAWTQLGHRELCDDFSHSGANVRDFS